MRVLPIALLFSMGLSGAPKETGFLNRTVLVSGTSYRYQVYVPADWTKKKQWPVILFLHGRGESGEDGLAQTEVGLGRALRLHPDRFPAVVVMPQCRKVVRWTDPEMERQALAALDKSIKEFHGDSKRVYLSGLSLGGYGTFAIGARHAGKFAALAPVCGGAVYPNATAQDDPYREIAGKIGKTPIWIFHGGADPTVPVTESRKMETAIRATGGNPRYTEYPGAGHNSWDKAYDEAELAKWLFEQRLP